MLVLGPQTIALLIIVPVLCFFVGKWLFTKDQEAEARKRAAIKVSATLTSMGLVRLPRILEAYAVNDWSGLAHEIKLFADLMLGDPAAIVKEFDGVFSRVLDAKLATAEGRALIAAKLAEGTPVA